MKLLTVESINVIQNRLSIKCILYALELQNKLVLFYVYVLNICPYILMDLVKFISDDSVEYGIFNVYKFALKFVKPFNIWFKNKN